MTLRQILPTILYNHILVRVFTTIEHKPKLLSEVIFSDPQPRDVTAVEEYLDYQVAGITIRSVGEGPSYLEVMVKVNSEDAPSVQGDMSVESARGLVNEFFKKPEVVSRVNAVYEDLMLCIKERASEGYTTLSKSYDGPSGDLPIYEWAGNYVRHDGFKVHVRFSNISSMYHFDISWDD